MPRRLAALLIAIGCLLGVSAPVLPSAANATVKGPATYIPKPKASCKTGYVKATKTIKVKVKQREKVHAQWRTVTVVKTEKEIVCNLKKVKKTVAKPVVATTTTTIPVSTTTTATTTVPSTTTTTVAPTPQMSYAASVDPSFVQSAINPLDVTYNYSADATSVVNGQSTDLGAIGQLPNGVLNLFNSGLLVCSMNVGGSTLGGSCAIDYASAGTYPVVVQYLSGTFSATQSDNESISVNSATTTTLSVSGYRDQGASQTVVSAVFSTAYGPLVSATVSFNVGGATFTPSGHNTSCTIDWSGGLVTVPPWSSYVPGTGWVTYGQFGTHPSGAILDITNNPGTFEIATSPDCSETGFGEVPDTLAVNADISAIYGATGTPNNGNYTSSSQSWVQ